LSLCLSLSFSLSFSLSLSLCLSLSYSLSLSLSLSFPAQCWHLFSLSDPPPPFHGLGPVPSEHHVSDGKFNTLCQCATHLPRVTVATGANPHCPIPFHHF